ncbi:MULTISPECIES: hypothetical protein [unclassified Pseudomonas]|uniref:hypothetical protein n=1 Tax=unclassified Pseudomonas TaxID=196821 RepID=UPI00215BDC25|nr:MULTISPECIES: hypothetical protein [unclassified Pseudomonas]MCR8931124.1 hypothetical protein [Pseudomonas sp. S11A4]MCR8974731.1 hypothetical protein [Pseudomonas sp. S11P7]
MSKLNERDFHDFIFKKKNMELLVADAPQLESEIASTHYHFDSISEEVYSADELEFDLWKIIKRRSLDKISSIHQKIRYGQLIASDIKLPTDSSRPMEMDLLGLHEDGVFIIELKTNSSAERNSFTELLAYSNYISETFPASGKKDTINVLIANLKPKITRNAYLYDLIIADRETIVYSPTLIDDRLDSLQLHLHIPSDDDFKHFTNKLISHDAFSAVVLSFNDMPGWFDSIETENRLSTTTEKNLSIISSHAAQLMEAEQLHGFCFIRKRWEELNKNYQFENSIIICAINPFKNPEEEQLCHLLEQVPEESIADFLEFPEKGFNSRLIKLAMRTQEECLGTPACTEINNRDWNTLVHEFEEVVQTHNIAFHATGILREAYTGYLEQIYRFDKESEYKEDISKFKAVEISNWLRAWLFMENVSIIEETSTRDDSHDDPDDHPEFVQYCVKCERFATDTSMAGLPSCGLHIDPWQEVEPPPFKGTIPDWATCFDRSCSEPPVGITGGQCFCEEHFREAKSGRRTNRLMFGD